MGGSSSAAEETSEEVDLHRSTVARHHTDIGGGRYATSSLHQQQPPPPPQQQLTGGLPTGSLFSQATASTSTGKKTAAVASSHNSVVPGLMRVYESMTQTGPSSPQAVVPDYGHHSQLQQLSSTHGIYPDESSGGTGNSSYYPTYSHTNLWPPTYDSTAGGGGAATSIVIPPPYQLPLPQTTPAQQPPLPHSAPAGRNGRGKAHLDSAATEAGTTTNSGRPMRNKRTIAAVAAAAAAAAAADDLHAGYGSSSTGSNSRGGTAKARRKGSAEKSNSKVVNSSDRRDSMNNSNTIASNATGTGADKTKASSSKDEKNDGRWAKRFTWPDDLHRDFVSAIFDVGLKHSSPSSVMEQMPPHEQITTERIKSHLQKYRLHRQKSKKEFMTSYETSIEEMNKEEFQGATALAGGQLAAHLTFASLNHPDPEPEDIEDGGAADETDALTPSSPNREILAAQKALSHDDTPPEDVFVLPRLTEEEKLSPIGTSLGYLMGLFFSLKQQLDQQRLEQQNAANAIFHKQDYLQHPLLDHTGGIQQDTRSEVAVFDSFKSELGCSSRIGGASASTAASAIAGTAIIPMSVPSTSRNLEENSMMKREMQSQMAFQNKMRALKQQELVKYKKSAATAAGAQSEHMLPPKKVTITTTTNMGASSSPTAAHNALFDSEGVQAAVELQIKLQQQPQQEFQLAGESEGGDGTAGGGGRERSSSVAMEGDDDFWNTAVVDDELFDFLMSN